MWKNMRHFVLKQYQNRVLPVVSRVRYRLGRRKAVAEIKMLEGLWEGHGEPVPKRLEISDNVARYLVGLKGLRGPVDFFFPGVRSEVEAEKSKKEMEALESLWPRDDDHLRPSPGPQASQPVDPSRFIVRHGNELRVEYPERPAPSTPKPWESLGYWVKPYDFHTSTESKVKVTKDLDPCQFADALERGVRSRLGNG